MPKSIHDRIAEELAEKFKTEYKSDQGIDIVTKTRVIEVETKKESLNQGIQQVVRSKKARYLAVNDQNIKNALNVTRGTGIGVMNSKGNIIKKASRKR